MKPNESVEDFSDRFLHLSCEFPEEDMDLDFLKQKFHRLFHTSFHGEPEPLDVSTSPTLVNHEKPLISKDGFTVSFVPCPPPFPIPMRVPPCNDNQVGKFVDQIPNPSLHPPSTFHDLDLIEETLEWFMEPRLKANPLIS